MTTTRQAVARLRQCQQAGTADPALKIIDKLYTMVEDALTMTKTPGSPLSKELKRLDPGFLGDSKKLHALLSQASSLLEDMEMEVSQAGDADEDYDESSTEQVLDG